MVLDEDSVYLSSFCLQCFSLSEAVLFLGRERGSVFYLSFLVEAYKGRREERLAAWQNVHQKIFHTTWGTKVRLVSLRCTFQLFVTPRKNVEWGSASVPDQNMNLLPALWLLDWLTGWLVRWLVDLFAGWLTGWLTGGLIEWLGCTAWLNGWLTEW